MPARCLTRRQLLAAALAAPAAAALAPLVGRAPMSAHAAPPPSYRIEADVALGDGTVSASQTVRLANAVGVPLDRAVFRVVPAAVGEFTLLGAAVDGAAAEGRLEGGILDVPLATPLAPGASAEIVLRYAMRLPRAPDRLAAAGRTIALGNWFPILTVHRGDWDRRRYVPVGDAFYREVATFDVTVTTDGPATVAGTGQATERGGTRWRFRTGPVRDFALAISPDYAVRRAHMGEVAITAYTFSDARSEVLADRAAVFLRWLSDALGPYSYPTLAVADVELTPNYGGMEYPGLIMLSPRIALGDPFRGGSLDTLLLHEIAHQWFHAIVGSDEIADPWLDEALTTYVTYLYYAQVEPALARSVFDRTISGTGGGPVDSAVTDFPDDPPYFNVVYRRGARFLDALRGQLGHDRFMTLLREHVATHRDRLATPRAFLDRAQSLADADLNPLIGQYFRYGAFGYPSRQTWTLEAPASPWTGSAAVFVGAEFPVSRVELWLDGRQVAGGPENWIDLDLSTVDPGEYVLLARVFNHENVVFERARRIEVR